MAYCSIILVMFALAARHRLRIHKIQKHEKIKKATNDHASRV